MKKETAMANTQPTKEAKLCPSTTNFRVLFFVCNKSMKVGNARNATTQASCIDTVLCTVAKNDGGMDDGGTSRLFLCARAWLVLGHLWSLA